MKRLWLLCTAVLAAALLCACGQTTPAPRPAEPEPEPEPSVPRIMALYCSDGERLLRFHRSGDGEWLWTDDVSFPLDGRYVDNLAAMVQALEGLEPLPSPEGPESYDLYNARKYLTVRWDSGKPVTYHFGKQTESGEYYVNSTADPDRICLAPERILTAMGRSVYDMALLPQLPAISSDRLQSVTIDCGDSSQRFDVKKGRWLQDDRDVTDEPRTERLRQLLESPALLGCLDYMPAPGAAALCGLEPPAVVFRAEYKNESGRVTVFSLSVGAVRDDGCCVTVNDDPTIYLMDPGPLAVLLNWNG